MAQITADQDKYSECGLLLGRYLLFRKLLINFFTRLMRASIIRLSQDVAVMQTVQAGLTSAALTSKELSSAIAVSDRELLLLRSLDRAPIDGLILELGVYKGHTLKLIANRRSSEIVYGLDSFDGLPENWRSGFEKGTFKIDEGSLQPLPSNVKLYRGLFESSLPMLLNDDNREAAFLHVDCDLYSSTKCALNILLPKLKPGTVIVFDEYFNFPGWEFHEYEAWKEISREFGITFEYLFYNPAGQQVSVVITSVHQMSATGVRHPATA